MSGWIKLHRKLRSHWIAKEPEAFALFIWMLLEAAHKPVDVHVNGTKVRLARGELVFGYEAWESKTGVKKRQARRHTKRMQDDRLIGRQITNKYSIISITNYDAYQIAAGKEAGDIAGNPAGATAPLQEVKKLRIKNIYRGLDFSEWPDLPTEQVCDDWLAHRARIKANATQTVVNRLATELSKAVAGGYSVDDCLGLIIEKTWRGFEFQWIQNAEKRNGNTSRPSGYSTGLSASQRRQQESADLDAELDARIAKAEADEAAQAGMGHTEIQEAGSW